MGAPVHAWCAEHLCICVCAAAARALTLCTLCDLPQIIFRTQPPPLDTTWAAIPSLWLDGEYMRLWASKGTLVPSRPRTRPYTSTNSSSFLPAKRQQTTHGNLDAVSTHDQTISSHLSSQLSSSSSPPNDPPCVGDVECGNPDGLGGSVAGSSVAASSVAASSLMGDSVAGGSVAGGSANEHHLTPPPFVDRYVDAHMHLKAMIEDRLQSTEQMPIEQREMLIEQVRAAQKGRRGRGREGEGEREGEREVRKTKMGM